MWKYDIITKQTNQHNSNLLCCSFFLRSFYSCFQGFNLLFQVLYVSLHILQTVIHSEILNTTAHIIHSYRSNTQHLRRIKLAIISIITTFCTFDNVPNMTALGTTRTTPSITFKHSKRPYPTRLAISLLESLINLPTIVGILGFPCKLCTNGPYHFSIKL